MNSHKLWIRYTLNVFRRRLGNRPIDRISFSSTQTITYECPVTRIDTKRTSCMKIHAKALDLSSSVIPGFSLSTGQIFTVGKALTERLEY